MFLLSLNFGVNPTSILQIKEKCQTGANMIFTQENRVKEHFKDILNKAKNGLNRLMMTKYQLQLLKTILGRLLFYGVK